MSSKEDNPFYSMVEIMRRAKGQSASPFLIGEVTATAPLTVQVGDIPVTRKSMKINSQVLNGLERGNEVVLLESADGQQYILLCKVV